jgi:DNA ligase-1
MSFKRLLSATYSSKFALLFPYLASAKLDGIRCVIIDDKPVSLTLKPIPNKFVQTKLSDERLNGLDGELIVGAPNSPECFRITSSRLMSHGEEPPFIFHVFDDVTHPEAPFSERLASAKARLSALKHPHCELVPHQLITSVSEFETAEREAIEQGYEGLMLRSLTGCYKFGRSTLKENILIKVKRFSDSEAIVIGFEELLHNANIAVTNALGHTKRSSNQDGKHGLDTLGSLLLRDVSSGVEFSCGSGFSAEERQAVWSDKPAFFGQLVKYKYFAVGVKNKPRHPVFAGWRQD